MANKIANRRSRLPKTLAGRVYRYDKDTVATPVEISPRSKQWEDVPTAQRHTRNYRLKYLPTGVRGHSVFSHDQLAELFKGKRSKRLRMETP